MIRLLMFYAMILMSGLPVSLWTQEYPEPIDDTRPLGDLTNYNGGVGSGARAFGMGGAFIAVADDASAASWNPAGLAQLERIECSFVTRYQDNTKAQSAIFNGRDSFLGAYISKSAGYNIDFASITLPFRIGNIKLVPQFSYQRAVNYRISAAGKNIRNWAYGKEENGSVSRIDGIVNIESHSQKGLDMVTFSIGSRLGRRVSFGFSVNYWFNGLTHSLASTARHEVWIDEVKEDFAIETRERVVADYEMTGFNVNAGLLLTLSERLRVGLVYKSALNADIRYRYFVGMQQDLIVQDQEPTRGDDQVVIDVRDSGFIDWPWSIGLGLAFNPVEAMTLSADFTYNRWSKAKFRHFSNIFRESESDPLYVDVPFPVLDQKQTDSWQARLGTEYVIITRGLLLPIRAGAFLDRQFFYDINQESIVFYGFTTGFGIKTKLVALDLALVYQSGRFMDNINCAAPETLSDLRLYGSLIVFL